MKLPHSFPDIEQVRKNMGAELINFTPPKMEEINLDDLWDKLNSIEGVEIDLEKINVNEEDGTYEYKGHKFIVYIRDVLGGKPKFHITECQTIKGKKKKGRL